MRPESVAPRARLLSGEEDVEREDLAGRIHRGLFKRGPELGFVARVGDERVKDVADEPPPACAIRRPRVVVVTARVRRLDPADDGVRVVDVSACRLRVVAADGRCISVLREVVAVDERVKVVCRHVRMCCGGERVRLVAVRVEQREVHEKGDADDCSVRRVRWRRTQRPSGVRRRRVRRAFFQRGPAFGDAGFLRLIAHACKRRLALRFGVRFFAVFVVADFGVVDERAPGLVLEVRGVFVAFAPDPHSPSVCHRMGKPLAKGRCERYCGNRQYRNRQYIFS